MTLYAIAEIDCVDCFYDFELNCFGDGICESNLLPSRKFAEWLMAYIDIPYGKVIEVEIDCDEEGILFRYENIWSK